MVGRELWWVWKGDRRSGESCISDGIDTETIDSLAPDKLLYNLVNL